MRFFSKVAFICNCCFVIAVILRMVENSHKKNISFTGAIQIQPLESLLVVLGYGAIFINFILNTCLLLLFVVGSKHRVAKWLIWVNFLFLVAQVYYFFFSNF